MENVSADRIDQQVRAAFPEGAIERVQVLTYGDDPGVEPGETAIRVFISRAGRPEGLEADKEIITTFEETSHAALRRLADELPLIGWIEFRPDTRDESVDTLIAAGVAGSRAEILRWAVGRIRENPAYAQLQDRVREISELKARF